MFANSDELLKFIKDEGVEMVDVRFCDLPGVMQHFTVPVSSFDQSVSEAGAWNTGSEVNNRGYKVKYKGGYFPVAPYDHFGDFRDEIVIELEKAGLVVERAHHEVGTAGQAEINWRFDELLPAADSVMLF